MEKDDPLQFLVVKEVVEAPQTSGLAERIRIKIGIVAVNVAVIQLNFVVNSCPQWPLQALVLLASNSRQIRVDSVHYQLNGWLFAEFVTLKNR